MGSRLYTPSVRLIKPAYMSHMEMSSPCQKSMTTPSWKPAAAKAARTPNMMPKRAKLTAGPAAKLAIATQWCSLKYSSARYWLVGTVAPPRAWSTTQDTGMR